jgi:hypothetical protein
MGETRKIVAILVADVVGYSRLVGADEDRTLSRLRGLRSDLIDPAAAAHARLAHSHEILFSHLGFDDAERTAGLRHARFVITSATDDATALAIAAFQISLLSKDHEGALSTIERALSLNLSCAAARAIAASRAVFQSGCGAGAGRTPGGGEADCSTGTRAAAGLSDPRVRRKRGSAGINCQSHGRRTTAGIARIVFDERRKSLPGKGGPLRGQVSSSFPAELSGHARSGLSLTSAQNRRARLTARCFAQ